ncbi:unnamed protein product [Hydatigera taeniaeformis]|uniref:Uncharacterized protein n=1 Tax=Hydatigena taeniaeformis TaxID=6205 RepID=A0A0R3WZ65_HYDTA|nr:unnamed protein product [Hydatigera taeniaeformis]
MTSWTLELAVKSVREDQLTERRKYIGDNSVTHFYGCIDNFTQYRLLCSFVLSDPPRRLAMMKKTMVSPSEGCEAAQFPYICGVLR